MEKSYFPQNYRIEKSYVKITWISFVGVYKEEEYKENNIV
jgi:hypothetical protein